MPRRTMVIVEEFLFDVEGAEGIERSVVTKNGSPVVLDSGEPEFAEKQVKLLNLIFEEEGQITKFTLKDEMRESLIGILVRDVTPARRKKIAAQLSNGKARK